MQQGPPYTVYQPAQQNVQDIVPYIEEQQGGSQEHFQITNEATAQIQSHQQQYPQEMYQEINSYFETHPAQNRNIVHTNLQYSIIQMSEGAQLPQVPPIPAIQTLPTHISALLSNPNFMESLKEMYDKIEWLGNKYQQEQPNLTHTRLNQMEYNTDERFKQLEENNQNIHNQIQINLKDEMNLLNEDVYQKMYQINTERLAQLENKFEQKLNEISTAHNQEREVLQTQLEDIRSKISEQKAESEYVRVQISEIEDQKLTRMEKNIVETTERLTKDLQQIRCDANAVTQSLMEIINEQRKQILEKVSDKQNATSTEIIKMQEQLSEYNKAAKDEIQCSQEKCQEMQQEQEKSLTKLIESHKRAVTKQTEENKKQIEEQLKLIKEEVFTKIKENDQKQQNNIQKCMQEQKSNTTENESKLYKDFHEKIEQSRKEIKTEIMAEETSIKIEELKRNTTPNEANILKKLEDQTTNTHKQLQIQQEELQKLLEKTKEETRKAIKEEITHTIQEQNNKNKWQKQIEETKENLKKIEGELNMHAETLKEQNKLIAAQAEAQKRAEINSRIDQINDQTKHEFQQKIEDVHREINRKISNSTEQIIEYATQRLAQQQQKQQKIDMNKNQEKIVTHGRQKGTKNKSTLQREKLAEENKKLEEQAKMLEDQIKKLRGKEERNESSSDSSESDDRERDPNQGENVEMSEEELPSPCECCKPHFRTVQNKIQKIEKQFQNTQDLIKRVENKDNKKEKTSAHIVDTKIIELDSVTKATVQHMHNLEDLMKTIQIDRKYLHIEIVQEVEEKLKDKITSMIKLSTQQSEDKNIQLQDSKVVAQKSNQGQKQSTQYENDQQYQNTIYQNQILTTTHTPTDNMIEAIQEHMQQLQNKIHEIQQENKSKIVTLEQNIGQLFNELEEQQYDTTNKHQNATFKIQKVSEITREYVNDIKILTDEVKLINARTTKVENYCQSVAHGLINDQQDQQTQRLNQAKQDALEIKLDLLIDKLDGKFELLQQNKQQQTGNTMEVEKAPRPPENQSHFFRSTADTDNKANSGTLNANTKEQGRKQDYEITEEQNKNGNLKVHHEYRKVYHEKRRETSPSYQESKSTRHDKGLAWKRRDEKSQLPRRTEYPTWPRRYQHREFDANQKKRYQSKNARREIVYEKVQE